MTNPSNQATIELRLDDSAQLFNTLDPFPFRQRDLSAEAEDFIVEWAEELPASRKIEIIIHLQSRDTGSGQDAMLSPAIRSWFRNREISEARAIKALFRKGRMTLLIGLAVLGLCLTLSWATTARSDSPFVRVLGESLIIVGWVVMWRPAEIFLYDWVPLLKRKKLFKRLSEAQVTVVQAV